MAELFAQLSVVSAIFGGFAFTFVGALLGHNALSKMYAYVFGASLVAAMAFTITALGSVLAALAMKNNFPIDIARLHAEVSMSFLIGVGSFVIATGSCGWLKSRTLGVLSTAIALLSAVGVIAVLSPFIAAPK